MVIITGASTSIGRATALKFSELGVNVVIGDVDERAQQTVEEIKSKGGKALFIKTDVSNAESVQVLVKQTVAEFGSLDFAFNNAGILNQPAKFKDIPVEAYDKVMQIDAKGVFLCMKYELEYMVTHGGGAIVNTASIAGLIADPQMAPYIAAKHAVVGLTKSAGLTMLVMGYG